MSNFRPIFFLKSGWGFFLCVCVCVFVCFFVLFCFCGFFFGFLSVAVNLIKEHTALFFFFFFAPNHLLFCILLSFTGKTETTPTLHILV